MSALAVSGGQRGRTFDPVCGADTAARMGLHEIVSETRTCPSSPSGPRGALLAVGEVLTLRVRNAVDAIESATVAAEAWLEARHASPEATFLVRLTIEELVTNAIKYGYDAAGERAIDVSLSMADHALTMVVVDDGRAFDPLSVTPPDLSLPLEDRPVGGLGIHLLRQLADEMRYERRDGTNRLTLVKRLP